MILYLLPINLNVYRNLNTLKEISNILYKYFSKKQDLNFCYQLI